MASGGGGKRRRRPAEEEEEVDCCQVRRSRSSLAVAASGTLCTRDGHTLGKHGRGRQEGVEEGRRRKREEEYVFSRGWMHGVPGEERG